MGILLASAGTPIALADPPGYYFKDFPRASVVQACGFEIVAADHGERHEPIFGNLKARAVRGVNLIRRTDASMTGFT
jgi:hypothetical protein